MQCAKIEKIFVRLCNSAVSTINLVTPFPVPLGGMIISSPSPVGGRLGWGYFIYQSKN
jgi:hypothetical protein